MISFQALMLMLMGAIVIVHTLAYFISKHRSNLVIVHVWLAAMTLFASFATLLKGG